MPPRWDMPSRFRTFFAQRLLALGLGAALCVAVTAGSAAPASARHTTSAAKKTQVVRGGIASAATASGVINLATLPAVSRPAVMPSPRATNTDRPLKVSAQLAAFRQWALKHASAPPVMSGGSAPTRRMPAPTVGNTYGSGAAPALIGDAAGLNSVDGGGWYPPDQALAAAPGYVFEGVNNVMEVYSTTFAKKYGPWTPDQVFASVKRSGDYFSDPQITFDAERSKYLISWLEINPVTGKDYIDIAVSKTSSPSPLGNFYVYQVDPTAISGGSDDFCDYDTLGYDYWGMYITCVTFSVSTGYFLGNNTFAFSINSLLSGTLGRWDYWYSVNTDLSCGANCPVPAYRVSPTIEDGVPQAEWISATDIGWGVTSTNLTVCAITNTHAIGTAILPTYTCGFNALPLSYDDPIGASQPGTSTKLYPGYGYKQVAYRNGQLYLALTMESLCGYSSVHDGILWAAVDPQLTTLATHSPQWVNGIAANYTQAGYLCYSSNDVFMPTLMPGNEGDVALVFNLSDGGSYADFVYTGRTAADAPGTMGQGSVTGQGTYTGGTAVGIWFNDTGRWGDYSACALTTNLVTRGILYCGGEWAGPNTKPGGWDTEIYAIRME